MVRHLQAQGVVGIEDRRVLGNLDRYPLDLGQLFQRIDAAQAEMVRRYVEAGRDVTFLEPEAAAQHPAASRFHDSRVDGRVAQDHLGRNRTRHVTGNR